MGLRICWPWERDNGFEVFGFSGVLWILRIMVHCTLAWPRQDFECPSQSGTFTINTCIKWRHRVTL